VRPGRIACREAGRAEGGAVRMVVRWLGSWLEVKGGGVVVSSRRIDFINARRIIFKKNPAV
jgi:hypothetical protein